jgi:transcriptional regulator with XRE-family HTH domain
MLAKAAKARKACRTAPTLLKRLDAAGITLTQVARAAKCSLSTVSHVLRGHYSNARVAAAAQKLLAKARR